ncbi:hypothetical protein IIE18_10645 [Pseudomonas sp. V1]|uniref:hypothetical protein n=1 Tax=Pseudomonas arcuscaelestis TaxID=2710591 RepID=UPI0019400E75|nr:hypothetical protein [Pseudomonas arcuscaelestis]MBM3105598.1 hypothetical protein [Pseudomonas arcuscaelestis]
MPDTQLEAYVALNGSSLTIEGKSIKVRNFLWNRLLPSSTGPRTFTLAGATT